jgi:hypothetical protein
VTRARIWGIEKFQKADEWKMKRIHKIRPLILIIVGLAICALAYEKFGPLENWVVVKRFDLEFPKNQSQAWNFLWDNFAHRPELEKFEPKHDSDWENKFHRFEQRLVLKAQLKLLDSSNLQNCLAKVFKDAKTVNTNLVYLPVGAYSTKQGTNEVWIIIVRWEIFGLVEDGQALGHIRMFAFDAKTHKVIGFSTCD